MTSSTPTWTRCTLPEAVNGGLSVLIRRVGTVAEAVRSSLFVGVLFGLVLLYLGDVAAGVPEPVVVAQSREHGDADDRDEGVNSIIERTAENIRTTSPR